MNSISKQIADIRAIISGDSVVTKAGFTKGFQFKFEFRKFNSIEILSYETKATPQGVISILEEVNKETWHFKHVLNTPETLNGNIREKFEVVSRLPEAIHQLKIRPFGGPFGVDEGFNVKIKDAGIDIIIKDMSEAEIKEYFEDLVWFYQKCQMEMLVWTTHAKTKPSPTHGKVLTFPNGMSVWLKNQSKESGFANVLWQNHCHDFDSFDELAWWCRRFF